MARIKLTKRAIDALIFSSNPRGETYFDTTLRGFGLVVYPSGRKSFFVNYGDRARRRRKKLGDYGPMTLDAARKEATRILADLQQDGIDPLDTAAARKEMPTFAEWADDYLEDVRKRKKRPEQDERYLRLAAERFGFKPLDEVTRDDVSNLVSHLANRGTTNTTANRFLASVRSCLNVAVEAGRIARNPASTLKSYPEPIPRARTLSDTELSRVIAAIEEETDQHVRAAFHMLIETGARKSEVLGAQWADIDFDGGLWRIPSPKAGYPQVMPLPSSTLAMLHVLPRVGEYVFPGKNADKPRRDLKTQWARIREKVGIPDVRIHDVRRTFGLQVARSAGLHVASKLLRHADVRVTERVYAPLGIEDLRQAMEKRTTAKIVPLHAKRHNGDSK